LATLIADSANGLRLKSRLERNSKDEFDRINRKADKVLKAASKD